MFRIVLECDAKGLSAEIGEQAAIDVAEEFAHRPWHTDVRCTWDRPCLRLEAQNDYDNQGLAIRDEFSDALAACVAMYERVGAIRIVSIAEF
jgi:hypothetical protein